MGALHFNFSISAAVFFGPLEESPCSLWQPPSLQYIGEWEWTVTEHLLWHFSAISPSSGFLCIFALFPTEDSLFILLSCFLSPMKRVVSLDSELTFKALCFTSTFCPSYLFCRNVLFSQMPNFQEKLYELPPFDIYSVSEMLFRCQVSICLLCPSLPLLLSWEICMRAFFRLQKGLGS